MGVDSTAVTDYLQKLHLLLSLMKSVLRAIILY